jgi:hypothetical protein
MGQNQQEGWTRLAGGDTISISKTALKSPTNRPIGLMDIRGPKGGTKLGPSKLNSVNMAELIAALVIASDDKTLRLAASMVRGAGLPQPFMTRGEVWALAGDYDVDDPQERFDAGLSAGDQMATIMEVMQPEPGTPLTWDQIRQQVASRQMASIKVGQSVELDGGNLVYARLAGEDMWVETTSDERRLAPADEVLEMIEEEVTEQQMQEYAKEVNLG